MPCSSDLYQQGSQRNARASWDHGGTSQGEAADHLHIPRRSRSHSSQDIERLGYKTNFAIYDEGDQLGLIRKIISRISAKNEKLDPQLARTLISRARISIGNWLKSARQQFIGCGL